MAYPAHRLVLMAGYAIILNLGSALRILILTCYWDEVKSQFLEFYNMIFNSLFWLKSLPLIRNRGWGKKSAQTVLSLEAIS